MKKLLGLLGTIMITGNAIPPVIAAAPNENKNIRFKRQMPKKYKPLNELITVIYLGELKDNYEDTILHAIARLNPNKWPYKKYWGFGKKLGNWIRIIN